MAKRLFTTRDSLSICYLVQAMFVELTDEERVDHDVELRKWVSKTYLIMFGILAALIIVGTLGVIFRLEMTIFVVWLLYGGLMFYIGNKPSYLDKNWQIIQEIIERRDQGAKAGERRSMIKTDEYGEVINDPETYQEIANLLIDDDSVIIGWTDQQGSHHDILFVIRPIQHGLLQGGLNWSNTLFVSVMRIGTFGFYLNKTEKHPGYIGEKLGMSGESVTTIALAELINGVIGCLIGGYKSTGGKDED